MILMWKSTYLRNLENVEDAYKRGFAVLRDEIAALKEKLGSQEGLAVFYRNQADVSKAVSSERAATIKGLEAEIIKLLAEVDKLSIKHQRVIELLTS